MKGVFPITVSRNHHDLHPAGPGEERRGIRRDIDLFISYSSHDRERVFEIVRVLNEAGISTWLDRTFIDGGDNYGPAIIQGIRRSRGLALICSAASMRSRNVAKEIMLAWREGVPYIPLLLDNYLLTINGYPDQVAYWLEGNQWIEVLDHPPEVWLSRVQGVVGRIRRGPSQDHDPNLIFTGPDLQGLLSIARYTDLIWPIVPAEANKIRGSTRGDRRCGLRDIAAPQEGVRHTFRVGDQLNIVFETDREGYLTLLDIGTSGRVWSVCPSRFIPDPHIEPGKHVFPAVDSPYPTFVASPPPGTEQLLAILSDKPLDLDWMPDDPQHPARVLTGEDISSLLDQLKKREPNTFGVYSTYFTIER